MSKTAIIDYGMGNLRSVQKALERAGAVAEITQNVREIENASKVVLPGVGAMQPAMDRLRELDLVETLQKIAKSGRPFLGICLGMQLLFEESTEGGRVAGLGILSGDVTRFTSLKVPQMGWNRLKIQNKKSPLWNGLPESPFVYFCHSYYGRPANKAVIAATTDYGIEFTSAVQKENIFAVQFHPEKSQDVGLKILENFAKL